MCGSERESEGRAISVRVHECPWRARAGSEIVTGGYLHTSRRAKMCLCRVRDGRERVAENKLTKVPIAIAAVFLKRIVTSLSVLLVTARP